MILPILDSRDAACQAFLARMLDRRGEGDKRIDRVVGAIIGEVRRGGDDALVRITGRIDGVTIPRERLRVSPAELEAARTALPSADRRALELAARRINAFHRRTVVRPFSYRDATGMRLAQIVRPLPRVGIYVPGGQAAYPSTVLMNAIPARVAGVPEIAMVSPPGKDGDSQGVLAAAAIAGVTEVYRIGGAQAIAALAYGTASIAPVDKIVGPGNAYVQAAKRMVYGAVDIDKIAGPSEVLVIADGAARAEWVGADMIAQAEHGSGDESAILLTPSRRMARAVAGAIERALADLPRAAAVKRVMESRGAAIVVASLEAAFKLANRLAPEHLELEMANPRRWLEQVSAAGAIFIGGRSPAPLGEYLAGPNHVLPTGGSARFASPLGAYDFLKRTSIIEASQRSLERLGPSAARLARMEGFEGHARAIETRLGIPRNGIAPSRQIATVNGKSKQSSPNTSGR
jgi:histidinol dehydrogenase